MAILFPVDDVFVRARDETFGKVKQNLIDRALRRGDPERQADPVLLSPPKPSSLVLADHECR